MSDRRKWSTALTDTSQGKIRIRGVDIGSMIAELSFAEGVYLLLSGKRPSEAEARMMDALLVSSLDHGLTPPSVLATRAVISGGNPLNAGVAAGVLAIGDAHGGAIEACARLLQGADPALGDPAGKARGIVAALRAEKKRMPGFGHRLHEEDPRTVALFGVAGETGFDGPYLRLVREIESALEEATGRHLPVNVDGAIAAILCEMGFDWRLGKGFFLIARTPGLVAHAHEERIRERPMRPLSPSDPGYDGPEETPG